MILVSVVGLFSYKSTHSVHLRCHSESVSFVSLLCFSIVDLVPFHRCLSCRFLFI